MTVAHKEHHGHWAEDVRRDIGYGLRALRRSPGFAVATLLSIALGVGATAGIFSLVDQVLLRSLGGVREPQQLVLLDWKGNALADSWGSGNLMSYPLCLDLQAQRDVFDGVFCRYPLTVNVSIGQQHDPVRAELVSGSYFQVLGVHPQLGRLIDESDNRQAGAHPVVVLSYNYWRNKLAGDPSAVGRKILVNSYPMTVIGVTPASFGGIDVGEAPSVWIPAMMKRQVTPEWDRLLDRRAVWMHVFGRLKHGVTAQQAKGRLQAWFASTLQSEATLEGFPSVTSEQRRTFFASTLDVLPGDRGRSELRGALERPLWMLMGGTMLLLLLTCSNVAGLLVARGASRSRELMTRIALGATRGRLIRQLLVESLVITIAGGVLGLLVGSGVARVLLGFLQTDANMSARIDGRMFVFALVVSIVTGGLCTLAPALRTRHIPLNERAHLSSSGGVRFRKVLVIGQIALTLVLLFGAGLFIQTLTSLQAQAPGAAARLITFHVNPPSIGYSDLQARQFMRELVRRLQELPLIERVAAANTSLLTGGSFSRTLTMQFDRRTVSDRPVYGLRVSPGFFATVGVRVIAGRDFDERDSREVEDARGFRSVIVNESFARRYFGGRSPVGYRLGLGNRPDTPTNIEIVGMIEDFSYRSLRATNSEHIFFPFWDQQSEDGTVYVAVRGKPEAALTSIRRAVAERDASLPLTSFGTFEDQINQSLTKERMLATLSSGFGATALLLSVVGLYGVMSFVAARRTQEIGVRLAFGATRRSAVWLVIRDALVMIGIGTALAISIAWAFRQLVEAQLFGVHAFDAPTMAGAAGGLAIVALSAAALPAWRAAMLPPMLAIQDQPESVWHAARVKVGRAVRRLTSRREHVSAPSVTLIGEFTGLVQRAASFSEAVQVALPMLSEKVGAESITLLEKVGPDEYRGGGCSIPARGVLMNRLRHFPHPLTLTAADFHAWLRWATELRPQHIAEIEQLDRSGARLAVALRTKREIVGALLLGAARGREAFSDSDKQVVSSFAEILALMIENARLNDRALEQERIRRDLDLAAEVQRRLLPEPSPSSGAATFAAFTLPARTIGGDFYDFVSLPGGHLGIAVADVAGKGIAAALLTSVVQASLRVISTDNDVAVAQVVAKMNRFLHRSTAANHYATCFYAQLDASGRKLRYVNAGHNPPYLVRRADSVEITELCAGGTVLGFFPDAEYEDAELDLCPGDMLVVFTDGVTEARNPEGDEFGDRRLQDLLQRLAGEPADEVASQLAARMREWIAGTEQHDDLTFVVVTLNHMPSTPRA